MGQYNPISGNEFPTNSYLPAVPIFDTFGNYTDEEASYY